MTSPRTLMIAGVVLIAVALGSTGHGYWWLFGLFWVIPHAGRAGGCGGRARDRRRHEVRHGDGADHLAQADGPADLPTTPAGPDPTQDRHEAFRGR